jgi:hypothetical protein
LKKIHHKKSLGRVAQGVRKKEKEKKKPPAQLMYANKSEPSGGQQQLNTGLLLNQSHTVTKKRAISWVCTLLSPSPQLFSHFIRFLCQIGTLVPHTDPR